MSASTQNIDQVSIAKQWLSEPTEVKSSIPTWQDIEKAILDILRAGIYYRKPKNKGFMSWYKKQLEELRGSEDPEIHVYEKAIEKFPNEEIFKSTMEDHKGYYKKEIKIRQAIENYYNLCYNIAKESFSTDEEREEEFQAWLNS